MAQCVCILISERGYYGSTSARGELVSFGRNLPNLTKTSGINSNKSRIVAILNQKKKNEYGEDKYD